MSQWAAADQGPALSRTAFIVAWTLATLLPWIATTFLWRASYDFPIAGIVVTIVFGAPGDEVRVERIYQAMHALAQYSGSALTFSIQAWLLSQFRDETHWWLIVGIGSSLVMKLLLAIMPIASVLSLVIDEAIGVRVVGQLLWVGMTWWLIRLWGWRERYWVGFNIVGAAAMPLLDHLCEIAPTWIEALCKWAGISDPPEVYVLGSLSTGLLSAVTFSLPMAWVLWQYVIVPRRDVAPPPAR